MRQIVLLLCGCFFGSLPLGAQYDFTEVQPGVRSIETATYQIKHEKMLRTSQVILRYDPQGRLTEKSYAPDVRQEFKYEGDLVIITSVSPFSNFKMEVEVAEEQGQTAYYARFLPIPAEESESGPVGEMSIGNRYLVESNPTAMDLTDPLLLNLPLYWPRTGDYFQIKVKEVFTQEEATLERLACYRKSLEEDTFQLASVEFKRVVEKGHIDRQNYEFSPTHQQFFLQYHGILDQHGVPLKVYSINMDHWYPACETSYSYDGKGNWIEKRVIIQGRFDRKEVRIIEYY